MDYHSIISYIIEHKKIFTEWHWFSYHFQNLILLGRNPFASSIINACLACESTLLGFSKSFIDAIASIGGKEKDQRQYEQLLQRLAELFVIKQLVTYSWETLPDFVLEPSVGNSKKNPEITLKWEDKTVGIEVKCPSLMDHIRKRNKNKTQIPYRHSNSSLSSWIDTENTTLPRDYPVLDFLLSADEKFKEFKKTDERFRGVLVIIWDDSVYEPISTILAPEIGLFTENSWALDTNGNRFVFENVDAVIIIRQLHQFVRASKEEPLLYEKIDPFDYGLEGQYPPKAFISNPKSKGIQQDIVDCFQAYTPSKEMGPEYVPTGYIFWITNKI